MIVSTGNTESAILDKGSTDNVNEIESQVELADTILSHGRELENACHKLMPVENHLK